MFDRLGHKLQMFVALLALPLVNGFDFAETSTSSNAMRGPSSTLSEDISSIEFHRTLAAAYFDLSTHASNSVQDRQIFVQKALSARNGETPEPARLDEWVLSDEQRAILAKARDRLTNHLSQDIGNRSKAMALTSFDCWVAHSEQAIFASDSLDCRNAFERAIGSAPRDNDKTHTTARSSEEAHKTRS